MYSLWWGEHLVLNKRIGSYRLFLRIWKAGADWETSSKFWKTTLSNKNQWLNKNHQHLHTKRILRFRILQIWKVQVKMYRSEWSVRRLRRSKGREVKTCRSLKGRFKLETNKRNKLQVLNTKNEGGMMIKSLKVSFTNPTRGSLTLVFWKRFSRVSQVSSRSLTWLRQVIVAPYRKVLDQQHRDWTEWAISSHNKQT